ncbi:MAG: BlaI/MecI/CopY family transcriptional regulator [Planctomycetota bacterium]
MTELPQPTRRELEILQVLWEQGEASVRQVYEALREELPIVQNTVQAFLRTMEEKGLVAHRTEGRTFIYRPVEPREETGRHILSRLLERIFDGSVEQLVESALSLKKPSRDEIDRLKALVKGAEERTDRVRTPRGES